MNKERYLEEVARLKSFGYSTEEIIPFLAKDFPKQDCEAGYSWDYLKEIMDEETFKDFSKWMAGQTCCICDGRNYNHIARQYEPSACVNNPHGGVAYRWDVHRFLGIIEGKEVWD